MRGALLCGVDGAPSAWLATRAAASLSARLRPIAVGADATGLADVELACAPSRRVLQIARRPVPVPATMRTGDAA